MEEVKEKPKVDPRLLATNYGFFRLSGGSIAARATCSMGTKNPALITAWIPVEWTEAFGHTDDIIKEWTDLVSEAISHPINLKEATVGFPLSYKASVVCKGYPHAVNRYNRYNDLTAEEKKLRHSDITDNEFYEYVIPSGTRTSNYSAFLLMRYLYCDHYIPIVKKALEIYPQLKHSTNKALSAILLAHTIMNFDDYYGLIANDNKYTYDFINPVFDRDCSTANSSCKRDARYMYKYNKDRITCFKQFVKSDDWVGLEEALYNESVNNVDLTGKDINSTKRPYVKQSAYWNQFKKDSNQLEIAVTNTNNVTIGNSTNFYFAGSVDVGRSAPEFLMYSNPTRDTTMGIWEQLNSEPKYYTVGKFAVEEIKKVVDEAYEEVK